MLEEPEKGGEMGDEAERRQKMKEKPERGERMLEEPEKGGGMGGEVERRRKMEEEHERGQRLGMEAKWGNQQIEGEE